jgi:hypothetical protein
MMIAMQSLISLAILFVLVFVLLNTHRVDRLRQDLFDIRDRLFDEAATGRLSFDSQAYRYTRTSINGMIRFAHRISLSRFFCALIAMKTVDFESAAKYRRRVQSASSEADRELCAKYMREANLRIAKHLGTSPFSFILFLPVISAILAAVAGIKIAG